MDGSWPARGSLDAATPNAPPPGTGFYVAKVMHARLKPVTHRFAYNVFSIFIDVDNMGALGRASPLLSRNRFNVVSVYDCDFGPEDGTALRPYIERLLSKAGASAPTAIRLLAFPRILGYAFNPISIYYCYDAQNRLSALIYEVRNTFGEKHTYVAAIDPHERGARVIRQERDKLFYVSPFLDMTMRYRFRVTPPDNVLRYRILETDTDGPILSATYHGHWQPPTTATILKLIARMPFATHKVIGGIHWEALKLWLKGARYHRRGPAPAPFSVRDGTTDP